MVSEKEHHHLWALLTDEREIGVVLRGVSSSVSSASGRRKMMHQVALGKEHPVKTQYRKMMTASLNEQIIPLNKRQLMKKRRAGESSITPLSNKGLSKDVSPTPVFRPMQYNSHLPLNCSPHHLRRQQTFLVLSSCRAWSWV